MAAKTRSLQETNWVLDEHIKDDNEFKKELLDMVRPISEFFRTAGSVKRGAVAVLIVIGSIVGTLWAAWQLITNWVNLFHRV